MQRRITVLLAACLSLTANAQVISGWNDDSGIIHTWVEDNEDPQGFSNTLEEFSDAKTDLEQMADPENLPEIGRRTITINGKEAQVPTMVVDGIDFYMLMPEGISIYMGANPTAFYEEPDQDTIKWIRYYAFFKRKYTSRIFKRFEEWQKFISHTMLSEGVPEEIILDYSKNHNPAMIVMATRGQNQKQEDMIRVDLVLMLKVVDVKLVRVTV